MATKSSKKAEQEPTNAVVHAPGDGPMRSPFIPLLWLLIPFIGVIAYGFLTSPRFGH